MTAKELAQALNNRQYGSEITPELEAKAKQHNLVVVFGGSDDLCEFRGAIYDEAGCYGGGEIYFTKDGHFTDLDDDEELAPNKIQAIWCKGDYSWAYATDIPHETFDILEVDEDPYCQGIVFSLDDCR